MRWLRLGCSRSAGSVSASTMLRIPICRWRRPPSETRENPASAFDRAPFASGGWWLNRAAFRDDAGKKIAQYKIKTRTPDTPIAALSGGNVQRAVLARELGGDVEVLIAANPCFGLDFAAVAQIHAEIMAARNRGAAVLLVSEDLDELLELSDRLVVMFHGQLVYEARASEADLTEIGRQMAGH